MIFILTSYIKLSSVNNQRNTAYINEFDCLLGKEIITNAHLSSVFTEFSEADISKMSGVRQRFSVGKNGLSSSFGAEVAELFFNKYGVDRSNIDYLIFCTEGPDYIAPATSCIVQQKLHLPKSIGTFDLSFGCSGYTYGLLMSKALVESGIASRVLFITADIPTQVVSKRDPYLNFIFSDAASVSLITNEAKGYRLGKFACGTDGGGEQSLLVRNSGFNTSKESDWYTDEYTRDLRVGEMVMNGEEIFRFSLKEVPGLVTKILENNECRFDEIDLFIFHQASPIILKSLKRKLNIPDNKFFTNLVDVGNTVSASIPLCLKDAKEKGVVKSGMKILIAGFGIGFSWSGTIIYT